MTAGADRKGQSSDKKQRAGTSPARSSAVLEADSTENSIRGSSSKQRREKKRVEIYQQKEEEKQIQEQANEVSDGQQSPRRSKRHELDKSKDADSKSKRSRPDSQRGIDEIAFISKGLKLIVINDRDSNFLPIISLNSSPFQIQAYMHSQQSTIQTVF